MSSVKETEAACLNLISLGEKDEERIDIYEASKKVKESLLALKEEFDNDVIDELRLQILKMQCERDAIYLERVLSIRNQELKERYADRIKVITLFKSIEVRVRCTRGKELEELLIKYACVERVLRKTSRLIFTLSADDRELINMISIEIGGNIDGTI